MKPQLELIIFSTGDYLGLTGQNGFFFSAWTDRRTGVPTEQIWARRFRIPPIPDPCTDPILTSAKITFNTANHDEDDNKDPDTALEGWLTTIIPDEWAGFFELSGSDNFEFKANSSHEFPIGLKGL